MSRLIVKALCLLFVGFAMLNHVFAQKSPYTYRRDRLGKFNLGMTMGIAYNTYRASTEINIADGPDTLRRIVLYPKPGLMLGVISNLNVADFLSLRMVPHFTFEQRSFEFQYRNGKKTEMKRIESSYFNVPIMAQWRTPYYMRHRIIVTTGLQAGWNMISDKKVYNNPDLLKIRTQDLSFVIGTGIILYGDRIKMTPEIRYCAGFVNVYEPMNTRFSSAIKYLYSQTLTFSINFE